MVYTIRYVKANHNIDFITTLFFYFLFAINFVLVAQAEPEPYAETVVKTTNNRVRTIQIDPDAINVLSASSARKSENLKSTILNFMFLWVESTAVGEHSLSWDVQSPVSGVYKLTAEILGKDASFEIICNGSKRKKIVKSEDWSRLNLGTIELKKGTNKIRLQTLSNENIKISALELTRPVVENEIANEAMSVRQDPDWFKDAGYGLMFQWTNRATQKKGDTIKEWEQKVNDFDVQGFADMVEESGAAYVIWSITWGEQFISAPIKALDNLIEGRTTKRDLLGEIADQLRRRGVKLIFYYHYGYDCYHSKDATWLQVAGGYQPDKTRLYENITNIIAEVGNRYGNKLNGWFFDGAQRYYDAHFDGTFGGIPSASFKSISRAARNGNSQRILTYNSWILPRVTEYQDYYSGEGLQQFTDLIDGEFHEGKHKGLMAHTCFPLEKKWGHIDFNTPISSPEYTADQLIDRILYAKKNRYPLSINLEMYEDGSVSKESLNLLKKIRAAVR